jgi:hypothetical protein
MSNPLIRRYQYSLLRPTQVWVYGIIYVSITALFLIINLMIFAKESSHPLPEADPQKLFRSLFGQYAVFQFIILWILAPYNISRVIPGQMLQKSYDFMRLLPLSAFQKMTGIMIGRNLILLASAAANFLFYFFFGLAGRFSWAFLFQITLLLLSGSVLLCLLALLMSLRPIQKRGNPFLMILVFFSSFGLAQLIGFFAYGRAEEGWKMPTDFFYGWEIPVPILLSGTALYFSAWLAVGILRTFAKEHEPLLTWSGAVLFQFLSLILLLGFSDPFRPRGSERIEIFYGFCILALVPTVLLPVGARRTYEKYLELSRFASVSKLSAVRFLRYSNLTLAVLLFLLWAGFSFVVCQRAGADLTSFLIFSGVVFSFYLVLMLWFELSVVLYSGYPKISFLGGFLLLLYLFLPYLLSALLEIEDLLLFSPLGYLQWTFMENHAFSGYPEPQPFSPAFLNAALVVVPMIELYRRYGQLASLRKKMTRSFSTAPASL